MKPSSNYPCMFLMILTLLIGGCSEKGVTSSKQSKMDAGQVPEMVRPQLSAKKSYIQGEDIQVSVRFPASDWKLIERQKHMLNGNGFWPWHIRIDGEYYRLDGGASPLFPPTTSNTERTSHLQLNMGKGLLDHFEWKPGEYHVAYVFRGITMCHPHAPDQEVHLDEWASNEVVFQVIEETEQVASGHAAARRIVSVNVLLL